MKSIVSIKKKIAIVTTLTCIATAIVVAIVFTRPKLYTVSSSLIIHNTPIRTTMDINRYAITVINDKDFADSISRANSISMDEYKNRVNASIDENKCIVMAVSAETPEDATKMSEQIIDLLNLKIQDVVSDQMQLETIETSELLNEKMHQIDSLKRVIEKIDSTVSLEVSKSCSSKDRLIEHKILLEKNPDYIFANQLMGKFANDYGNALAYWDESKNMIDKNMDFINIIKKANPEDTIINVNKTKSIVVSAFLAFICSICLVSFWNILASRFNKNPIDEK